MSDEILVEIHIADLHFAAFNPETQYNILKEQFLDQISLLKKIDIISVDGDIFDHKLMANSDGVMYATLFVDQLVMIAAAHNATVILLQGTYSHDSDQLKLFYHYMQDSSIDVRVITDMQFIEAKGARILCIPELYGIDESVYRKYLFGSGLYDACFIHGTIKGAVYGDIVGNGRLFTIEDFKYCRGPIISGHIHTPGCFDGYYYYCGSPYRWKFGEEEDKGFLIVFHDLNTGAHSTQFIPITSFRYDTIYVDELKNSDPKIVIDWITKVKEEKGIDFIKVRFRTPVPGASKTVISNHYRNSPNTFVEFLDLTEEEKIKSEKEALERDDKYAFILDDKLSDLDKFVMYVNEQEHSQFITVDKLKEILEDEV